MNPGKSLFRDRPFSEFNHPVRLHAQLVPPGLEGYNRLSYKILRSKGTVLRAVGKEAA